MMIEARKQVLVTSLIDHIENREHNGLSSEWGLSLHATARPRRANAVMTQRCWIVLDPSCGFPLSDKRQARPFAAHKSRRISQAVTFFGGP